MAPCKAVGSACDKVKGEEMSKAYIIYKVSFDSLENHNPIYKKAIAVASIENIDEVLRNIKDIVYYIGYDNQIYPKFDVEVVLNERDGK